MRAGWASTFPVQPTIACFYVALAALAIYQAVEDEIEIHYMTTRSPRGSSCASDIRG